MTVSQLCESIGGKIIAAADASDNLIKGGYTCDFLSFVIGKAKSEDAWITVIGNVNTIAVASLADVGCIILAEDSPLDEDAKDKAEMVGIPVISSSKNSFELSVELGKLLGM
ncbi:MAG: hypothetical protein IJF54_05405 [Clostridia bacterium]|nr:hypothetical protein [Clostridia bacterium]